MAEQPKRMNLMQLTFIVAVNMMGSGIIMPGSVVVNLSASTRAWRCLGQLGNIRICASVLASPAGHPAQIHSTRAWSRHSGSGRAGV